MNNAHGLDFPSRLEGIRDVMRAQTERLRRAAAVIADALAAGGCAHVYANGHSRIAIEEMCVRMGALTGFRPLLNAGLATFTDVVGPNGIRVNQSLERIEGIGEQLLAEVTVHAGEPLLVISATGQTQAAVDTALAWRRRYPENPLIAICSVVQAKSAPAKHSSGMTLWHVVDAFRQGILLDNAMPYGDTSVEIIGRDELYHLCPLSSIGALSVVHCLNELIIRDIECRGLRHPHLHNMHLAATAQNYDAWIDDQRRRYARALNPRIESA